MQTPALWAFEEDILTRSWLDWLNAHTSFLKPLHRYEGVLTILYDKLHFVRIDKRTDEEFILEISKDQIEQLYLGFDETFNAWETRNVGLTWLPLRLTFTDDKRDRKLYLITNYHGILSDNQAYFEFFQQWLS